MKFANRNRIATSKFKVNNKIMLNTRNIAIAKLSKFLKYRNINSYEIVKAINNYVYELKLFELINLIKRLTRYCNIRIFLRIKRIITITLSEKITI